MVHQNIIYIGELRCEAVHGPSGVKLVTDAPIDNKGKGESFSPTDLIVTALASCVITTTGIIAEQDNIKLNGTKIYAEKHMSAEPPRRIVKIVLRFEMPRGIPKHFRLNFEKVASICPVKQSLNPEIEVKTEFRFPD
jgi:putative redox protein